MSNEFALLRRMILSDGMIFRGRHWQWVLAIMLGFLLVADCFAATAKPTKPKITVQPVKQTVVLGGDVSFEISVQSTTPVSYQWRLNKVAITGAISPSYSINPVAFESGGKYDVVITNDAGAVTSRQVALIVDLVPPRLPVGTALYTDLTVHGVSGTGTGNRAWMVSIGFTVIDPENPQYDPNSHFAYHQTGVNQATLIMYRKFHDPPAGIYISEQANYTLIFTGVSSDGKLECTCRGTVIDTPPEGYKPTKKVLAFSGTTSIDLP